MAQPSNFCEQNADTVSLNRRKEVMLVILGQKEIQMPYYNMKIYLATPKFTLQRMNCLARIELNLKIIFSSFSRKRDIQEK